MAPDQSTQSANEDLASPSAIVEVLKAAPAEPVEISAAPDVGTEEPEVLPISEAVSFELKWWGRRQEIREKEVRLEKAKAAQAQAEAKITSEMAAKPKVIVEFSESEGFTVRGATRPIASELGRRGLGFDFYGPKALWYIRGSRHKAWDSSYMSRLEDIKKLCKERGFELVTNIPLRALAA